DLEWLQEKARYLVKKYWGISEIPNIVLDRTSDEEWENYYPKEENRTLLGLYHNKDFTVEFNSKVNSRRKPIDIQKTLLHELCHWYLHINKLPHRDSDVRFACELIRVGAKPNTNHSHYNAYKEARKVKKNQVFEIIDNGENKVVTRLTHPKKDENDFKRDLKNCLIRIKNDFQDGNIDEYHSDDCMWVGDLSELMCKWYGYIEL
ncbi:hypothetical protein D7X33_48170, partial [Butyricicoccus sp. 1XD8-22]